MNSALLTQTSNTQYWDPLLRRPVPKPKSLDDLVRSFLSNERFLLTGPTQWDRVSMGQTTIHYRAEWVYTERTTGEVFIERALQIDTKEFSCNKRNLRRMVGCRSAK